MQEAYDLGTREIGFYSMTEPFTSHILELAILEAKRIGFEHIYITTNGSIATSKRIRKVFENGLNSIKFSVNAGNVETYKKIHGKNDFDEVIKNIKLAYSLKCEINPNIGIFVSFVECSYNKGEDTILKKILEPYIDKFYAYKGINQGGSMYEELKEGIITETKIKMCEMVFNRFHITPQGYLTACCVDPNSDLAVADLNKISLKDAWNCNAFVELRKQHLSKNIDPNIMCYNCIHNENNKIFPIMRRYATK